MVSFYYNFFVLVYLLFLNSFNFVVVGGKNLIFFWLLIMCGYKCLDNRFWVFHGMWIRRV